MPKKPKRGRPKLNPSERKGDLLQVRVPPGLGVAIKKAAKAEGLKVSALVRKLLEDWLGKRIH